MSTLVLSPNYHLLIEASTEASMKAPKDKKPSALDKDLDADLPQALHRAFQAGSGYGLLFLDDSTETFTEEPAFAYWKDFVRLYLSLFAATPDIDQRDLKKNPVQLELPPDDLSRFLLTAPPMKGAEYINEESLRALWTEISLALHADILKTKQDVAEYFSAKHSRLNLLGRVCFHLAENKKSPDKPFAFLATYAHRVSKEGTTQHLPLNRALSEYASAQQKNVLLRLLSPIHKASKESPFLHELTQSEEIYQTLLWTPQEAHRFLVDIPVFEKAGIAVRVPNWWKPKHPTRPQISLRLGEKKPSGLGFDALVDFSMSVVLNDQELSRKEIQDLLASSENLIFFKGQWIEVDRDKLGELLNKWKSAAKSLHEGLSFGEALRLLSGLDSPLGEIQTAEEKALSRVVSGQWLSQILKEIQTPETDKKIEQILKSHLHARLRPYQKQGVAWLHRLHQLRLGGILADDMGLGKTIQILSLLLIQRHLAESDFKSLLVVPASLIGNWRAEVSKFSPSLRLWVAHPSGDGYGQPPLQDIDLVMTTYGSLNRGGAKWIADTRWSLTITDEAQAIKNPGAKQTKAIKSIPSQHRLALTGTPVENQLSDLWSLFDFVSPGLLGSSKEFETFMKQKKKDEANPYLALRTLIRPYILRRLKTDKSVIQDLPEKTELKSFCPLSKAQAALYQKSVESLAREIQHAEGLQRRGVILSYLMRFKQICNHPSQFVKEGHFEEKNSGKFQRLREICEVIAEKQEKVLIFTQFKEMTEPLNEFLAGVFGRPGLVLHGETGIKKRAEMVTEFQKESGPSYFILSLKAGGTGLTLTAASHVIHFDRWWNPAVENQATDRAFRIGQKKNVLVHKFICKGTLEEKIDTLIESKKSMSQELLEEGGAPLLTELGNEELLKIVALDINSAVAEP